MYGCKYNTTFKCRFCGFLILVLLSTDFVVMALMRDMRTVLNEAASGRGVLRGIIPTSVTRAEECKEKSHSGQTGAL
jgi:hypothetical protein